MQSETESSTERLIEQIEREEENERLQCQLKIHPLTADQVKIFTHQHRRIIMNQPYIYAFSENFQKNRFNDIVLFDKSRVCLSKISPDDTDYIHASYVGDGFGQFILTQCPLENTTVDFWRMIWQEGVRLIVCLTQCKYRYYLNINTSYWPFPDHQSVGYSQFGKKGSYRFEIINKGANEVRPLCFVNELIIRFTPPDVKKKSERRANLLHFVGWPRDRIPDIESVVNLTELMWQLDLQLETECERGKAPIVLQCGSGVGRSATLVTISMCCRQLLLTGKLNIVEQASLIQRKRFGVLKSSQYFALIYLCAMHFATRHELLDKNDADLNIFSSRICPLLAFDRHISLSDYRKFRARVFCDFI